jgi:hypothetical protein
LLQRLNKSHHNKAKPVAAPSNGERAIEPLPTTLPVTMILGPINFKRWINDVGALIMVFL